MKITNKYVIYFLGGSFMGILLGIVARQIDGKKKVKPYVVCYEKANERIPFLHRDSVFYPDSTIMKSHNVIIGNPQLAATLGIEYLKDIYGEEIIKGEYPFNIVEFQHSWLIFGNLPKGCYGGVGSINICKRDGMVISYRHEK